MGFICLHRAVSFHPGDNGEATLVRSTDGATLSLNCSATLLLQAAFSSETPEQALRSVGSQVDASAEVIAQALTSALDALKTQGWIEDVLHPASPTSFIPAERVSCSPQENGDNEMEEEEIREVRSSRAPTHGEPLENWDGSWEIFLDGRLQHAPLPAFSWQERGRACLRTTMTLLSVGGLCLLASLSTPLPGMAKALRASAWQRLSQSLLPLRQTHTVYRQALSPATCVRLARRELVLCRLLAHLLPPSLCLEQSLACCCYLRTLGLPTHVVIGQSRFGKVERFAFHAWVELEGRVINDLEELQTGYQVLQRLPPSAEGNHHLRNADGRLAPLLLFSGGMGVMLLACWVYASRRRKHR